MLADEKKMGFWTLLSFVIGSQVGSGIFLLPASLAPLGLMGLLGWAITGSGALLLALVFSQLCAAFPQKGGPAAYVQEAFGRRLAFYTAWTYWIVSWASTPIVLTTIVASLSPILGPFSPVEIFGIECVLLAGVTYLNCRGIQTTSLIESCLAAIKVVPLVLIPFGGLYVIFSDGSALKVVTDVPVGAAVSRAAFLTLWCFIGLETATTPAGHVHNPRKTIPWALVVGTGCVVALYLLNTGVILSLIPSSILTQTTSPYTVVAARIWGPGWEKILGVLVALVCLGTLNAWVFISGQIGQGAAVSGLFPPLFSQENKSGSPVWSVLISSLGLVPFLFFLMNQDLMSGVYAVLDLSVTAFLWVYALCVAAYLKLLWVGRLPSSYLGWALGLAAAAFCLWAFWASGLKDILIVLLIPALGYGVQGFFMQKKLQVK